jgi:hypothetical protein
VAGAAAVVMSAQPSWSGAQVRTFLEEAAIDKGTVGMDTDFGWGRLNLGPSPFSTCGYTLDQSSLEFGVGSGSAIVNVDTGTECFWTAESQSTWLRTPIDNDTGPGRVIVLAEANPGPTRTGSLLIAGITVPVTQAGNDCSYAVEPLAFRLSGDGGAEELEVTAPDGCAWTAASQEDWIVVTGGASGSGSGTVAFAVYQNRHLAGVPAHRHPAGGRADGGGRPDGLWDPLHRWGHRRDRGQRGTAGSRASRSPTRGPNPSRRP